MREWHIALIALTMILEARNQPEVGQLMVAQVVLNRGGTERVEQVLYQPAQFAVWQPGVYAPGHALRLAALECHAIGAFPDDPWCVERWLATRCPSWPRRFRVGEPDYWRRVHGLATAVYDGRWTPPPGWENKTHFDNPRYWPHGLPPWLNNCERIADHVFCD